MTVGELTADGRARVLADGNQMPVLGLGVWQVPAGPACVNAVRWALDLGYRHIDTAQAYGNEESVGRALRDSGVPRDEVFITTKFDPGRTDPVAEAEQSLRRLGVDQVDLYLVHWPRGGPRLGLARDGTGARSSGSTRSVGVSNFSVGRTGGGDRRRDDPAGRQPGAVQPGPLPARPARRVPAAGRRARGLQPAGHRPAPVQRGR